MRCKTWIKENNEKKNWLNWLETQKNTRTLKELITAQKGIIQYINYIFIIPHFFFVRHNKLIANVFNKILFFKICERDDIFKSEIYLVPFESVCVLRYMLLFTKIYTIVKQYKNALVLFICFICVCRSTLSWTNNKVKI